MEVAREESRAEQIAKPGGDDKVVGVTDAQESLKRQHAQAKEQGTARPDLKAAGQEAKEVSFMACKKPSLQWACLLCPSRTNEVSPHICCFV